MNGDLVGFVEQGIEQGMFSLMVVMGALGWELVTAFGHFIRHVDTLRAPP
jgi:hypothetical protein